VDGVDGIAVVDGSVEVGPDMMTGLPGVFAGGDVVNEARTVTSAIGQGKRAARRIDAYLRREQYQRADRPALATADRLHPWYYSDAPHMVRDRLDIARRLSTFDEVVQGLDEETALFEARRCLSCGNCFECDNCFGMCPDNAVIKLGAGQRFAIDLEYCKGCGICAAECPCGAITMVPEDR
jgi:2-oxoacid:acceptor oxidoreductase delta subunit (pyruvate/2-ketoisovalerate family)